MLGRTNTGGGGVGGVLTVTAPAGVVVEVSKDGKTKRKTSNAEGIAVFKGLATGTWTLTITNGNQTATKTVVITADYSTTIAFFAATINITYPAGSTCTCSDGTTTLTAPDTSGTWACIVPNAGTWTVTCTDGTNTKSDSVSITADGQSKSITLNYRYYLFKAGSGFVADCVYGSGALTTIAVSNSKITAEMNANTGAIESYVRTKNKIDVTPYSTMYMECIYEPYSDKYDDSDTSWDMGFGLSSLAFTHDNVPGNAYTTDALNVALKVPTKTSTKKTFNLDISRKPGTYYVGFWGSSNVTVYNIWLE